MPNKPIKKKSYHSTSICGNMHAVALWMNQNHPDGNLIAVDIVTANSCIVIWRE